MLFINSEFNIIEHGGLKKNDNMTKNGYKTITENICEVISL